MYENSVYEKSVYEKPVYEKSVYDIISNIVYENSVHLECPGRATSQVRNLVAQLLSDGTEHLDAFRTFRAFRRI